jgi:pyridoxal phosphate enzyme (YggS family)
MIKQNIEKILAELPKYVKLVAVTKTRTTEEIKEAIGSGVKIIGENKIQEAEKKYWQLQQFMKEKNVKFHFIGHLQKNKAKKAVEMFDMIQTVDSIKLAEELNKRSKEINKIQEVLVEINIGKEEQKAGVMPEDAEKLLSEIKKLCCLKVRGLMCIPPFSENPEDSRYYFKEIKKLFERFRQKYSLDILSMGMSSDYKIAIGEGSNMVRIGTAIFGEHL